MSKLVIRDKPADPEGVTTRDSQKGFAAKTILFNDDTHTFEEVAAQLVKAIRCPFSHGLKLAYQVHHKGSEIVYTGHMERCEAVAMVLGDIGLRVIVQR